MENVQLTKYRVCNLSVYQRIVDKIYFHEKSKLQTSLSGATQFIKELSESGGKMAGESFVLKALKHNLNDVGEIISFEVTFSNEADEIGDIIVDVVSNKGTTTNIYNEFKNWKSIFENRYESFTRQFTGYLSNKDIGEFYYFFKKGVGNNNGFDNLTELKNEVTNAFKNKKEFFENLPDNKFESIFGFSKGIRDLDNVDIQNFIDNNFEQIFKLID